MPCIDSLTDDCCILFMQLTEMRKEGEEIHQEEEGECLSVVGRSQRLDEGKADYLLRGKR